MIGRGFVCKWSLVEVLEGKGGKPFLSASVLLVFLPGFGNQLVGLELMKFNDVIINITGRL